MSLQHKELYKKLEPQRLPLFFQPFYLEIVSSGMWDVIILLDGKNNITGVMPYCYRDKEKKIIQQPQLTIYLGPLMLNTNFDIGEEIKVLENLEDQLPPFSFYNQQWHPSTKNWLPFFWKGYNQSTRYSYIIDPDPIDLIRSRYSGNIRRYIQKAQKDLIIEESVSTSDLILIIGKTFQRKQSSNPYRIEILEKLTQACLSKGCGKILLAKDSQKNVCAGIFIVWDHQSFYYLAGGVDEGYKQSGAMPLLIDSAINEAVRQQKIFDFEGSMIKSIEFFFRSFGARQQQYFLVSKNPSLFFKIKIYLSRWIKFLDPFK